MKFTSLFAVLLILVLASIPAAARADITVLNPSFELTSTPLPLATSCGTGCSFNAGPIPDWTVTAPGSGGSFQPNSTFFTLPLPDGGIVAYSNGGTISQTLSTSLAANTTYMLSVDVGRRLDEVVGANAYSISLYAGTTLLGSFSDTIFAIPIGTFADETVTFTSGATIAPGALSIVLTSDGSQTNFDDVHLTASTVPEPSSLSLLAGALGVMFLALRRR